MPTREAEQVSDDHVPEEATQPEVPGPEGVRVLNSQNIANKYEAAIVAAMEARRLNDITRVTGESLSARVTQMAIENVRSGRVNYTFDEPISAAPTEPEE